MSENKDINYRAMKAISVPNNEKSAYRISQIIMEAVHPESVVDIGCGIGVWLKAFEKRGVKKIHGVDGTWVKNWRLEVPSEYIETYDFEDAGHEPQCLADGNHFDLAICLEMGEHLSSERADVLVDTLVRLSNVVYFSGATPRSGGMHHVNERWQSYWIHKFEERGYQCIDYVRPKIWNKYHEICYFYAEESFLFVKKDCLQDYPLLAEYQQESIYDCVHPEHFLGQCIKPTHDWDWLIECQKRLFSAFCTKFKQRDYPWN